MDKELQHGNAKRFSNESIIGDYNGEGYDSVESEDFDPGYGCVPVFVPRSQPVPPPFIDGRTKEEKKSDSENLKYFFMTDTEKEKIEDEYLKTKGL